MQLRELGCCGIKEIVGCQGWDTDRERFFHLVRGYSGLLPCAWVCVNGVNHHHYVEHFAAFVEENKLGPLVTLPPAVNPNSGNTLDVRMWQVDRAALLNWYNNHGPCKCAACSRERSEQDKLKTLIVQQIAQTDAQARLLQAPAGVRVNSF